MGFLPVYACRYEVSSAGDRNAGPREERSQAAMPVSQQNLPVVVCEGDKPLETQMRAAVERVTVGTRIQILLSESKASRSQKEL
jgi:hypothetical protein